MGNGEWIEGQLDNVTEFTIESLDQLPFLRNPSNLVGKDDLTLLSHLHEPAILDSLKYRFVEKKTIYTYCGIVLVAINPYTDCSHLYGDDIIQMYKGVGKSVRELDPHIFADVEEAFHHMHQFAKSQSIVSGASGAGKTVSAKFVMRYLTSVASSSRSGEEGIEKRVLLEMPKQVLEMPKPFDNGKRIAGAEMKTKFGIPSKHFPTHFSCTDNFGS